MARNSPAKPTAARARRRADLRRVVPKPAFEYRSFFNRPDHVRAVLIFLLFAAIVSTIVVWSREQVRVRDGQIMTETRLKRLDYQVLDEQKTANQRDEARKSSPRVYRLNQDYLARLEARLLGLPVAVEGKTDLAVIQEELREEFELTATGLAALQKYAVEGRETPAWHGWVQCLIDEELQRSPIIDSGEFQTYTVTLRRDLLLSDGSHRPLVGDPIELRPGSNELRQRLRDLARRCSFPEDVAPYIVARLTHEPTPTILFAPEHTTRLAEEAVAKVQPVTVQHTEGEILYKRGDELTAQTYLQVTEEAERFAAEASLNEVWVPRFGLAGLCLIMVILLGLFTAVNYPRVLRNTLRVTTLCVLMAGSLLATVAITSRAPHFLYAVAIGSTLFVAVVMRLAYDQRLAIVLAALQCALVAIALEQSVGWFVLLLAGCAAFIAQLHEVRHRNTMIRAATVTALVVGVAAVVLGLYVTPSVPGALRQIIFNAGWSVAASFAVGFLVLGILPSIERLFDITTGMTLAELRDPKQPLLRQLQQRAPGTYNHSLQVANICEAAAEAIGANGLLLYVGALYHDVGKLNKPEYFIENQAGGYNRHEKLSPAMSLLVIIGHVKDGIELAREYNLPRQVIHFIESHHGTTLVEYFYHAARTQAEAEERGSVDEVVFRYPGPKPQTREAAILMLADAVESATRAIAEPTPGRIESLVRELSRKRLTDGQFDQCPLTFRELGLIEDTIISRLCAIHHGRISYPSRTAEPETGTAIQARPASA